MVSMITDNELVDAVNTFAGLLSNQPLGLVHYCPEEWSEHTKCFENAIYKVEISGGGVQFGWMFSHRLTPHIPNTPGYLMATHHAVWRALDGSLVDVTPLHPDPKHHPFRPSGSTLFQVDDAAELVAIKNYLVPQPLLFYPLSQDVSLIAYVNSLNDKEHQECRALYDSLI